MSVNHLHLRLFRLILLARKHRLFWYLCMDRQQKPDRALQQPNIRHPSPPIPVSSWILWPSTAAHDTGGKMHIVTVAHGRDVRAADELGQPLQNGWESSCSVCSRGSRWRSRRSLCILLHHICHLLEYCFMHGCLDRHVYMYVYTHICETQLKREWCESQLLSHTPQNWLCDHGPCSSVKHLIVNKGPGTILYTGLVASNLNTLDQSDTVSPVSAPSYHRHHSAEADSPSFLRLATVLSRSLAVSILIGITAARNWGVGMRNAAPLRMTYSVHHRGSPLEYRCCIGIWSIQE